MARERFMRYLLIPLLGLGISYGSGIAGYNRYSFLAKSGTLVYFTFTSFFIWQGCQWIHIKMRGLYPAGQQVFLKLLTISMISGIYGLTVSGFMGLFWFQLADEPFSRESLLKMVLASVSTVVLFTLMYEILYLSKEKEQDSKMVQQLDQELSYAEIQALRNEIDPHFIFNSLNTLRQLISCDSVKAVEFNNRLAEVYKYYLVNKNKRWISLEKEMAFVQDYFFLHRLRHGSKLQLVSHLPQQHLSGLFSIPCAIQMAVENAIKHNSFSNDKPLIIHIESAGQFVTVKNNPSPRDHSIESTRLGLKNLRSQYQIMTGQNLEIISDDHFFAVKLPVLTFENTNT